MVVMGCIVVSVWSWVVGESERERCGVDFTSMNKEIRKNIKASHKVLKNKKELNYTKKKKITWHIGILVITLVFILIHAFQ